MRAGENTLETARDNPPDRVIADDDILFLDFGPIFEDWEADFGRTYVLGDDPGKRALRDALPAVWQAGQECFLAHPDITGAELFDHVVARHLLTIPWSSCAEPRRPRCRSAKQPPSRRGAV